MSFYHPKIVFKFLSFISNLTIVSGLHLSSKVEVINFDFTLESVF